MPTITGGRVVYGRTVQPAQYESKKAEVELAFGVEDGTPEAQVVEFINATADRAAAHAHRLLGINTGKTVQAETKAETKPAKAPKAEPKAEKPKDDLDLDTTAKPNISTGEERKDPTQIELEEAAKPTKITDKDLLEAVTRASDGGKNFAAISEVRKNAKYAPPPKRLSDMADEHRAAFIAEIMALLKK